LTIVYIVLLLTINAFFVAAEFALVKVSGIRIEALAAEGSFLGKNALKIKRNLDPYLAACQLGITMASLGLGWIGEPAVAAILHPIFESAGMPVKNLHTISFLIGFVLFSSLHIVIGEQVPKTWAIRSAEKAALYCTIPLIGFFWMVYPINWLLNKTSTSILRLMGVKEVSHVEVLSGIEISGLIDVSSEHGVLDTGQALMLQNLFRFDERVVHSIMLPRTKIDYLDYGASREEIITALEGTGHSRLPVIDGSWDSLKGVVIVKELLLTLVLDKELNLDSHIRTPQLVPESQAIRVLFETMRSNRQHLAFVVDEFGQIDGIITLEDLLEEVFGDIDDETDQPGDVDYIEDIDGGWRVNGLFPLHDFSVQTGFEPAEPSPATTVSGFLVQRLQSMPVVDAVWVESGFGFTILELDGARIGTVFVKLCETGPVTQAHD
jgi:CBS domain containing-hemolysin-like protein